LYGESGHEADEKVCRILSGHEFLLTLLSSGTARCHSSGETAKYSPNWGICLNALPVYWR
jgi:hypothetical protein